MLEYLKVAPTYGFSYEYCEIFKDTYFEEYLQTAASFTRKVKIVAYSPIFFNKKPVQQVSPQKNVGLLLVRHIFNVWWTH